MDQFNGSRMGGGDRFDGHQSVDKWLKQLKANCADEEYLRINYKTIVDSLLDAIVGHKDNHNIDVHQPSGQQLYQQLLHQLMATLDYNRRHPSRQIRSVETVDRFLASHVFITRSDQLMANTCRAISGQNLLMKAIKALLKDSVDHTYGNDTVLRVADKLVKSLDTIRECLALASAVVTTNQSSNAVIVLNNLILNTIRCTYLLINGFKFTVVSLDLNQFCGQLLGQLKCFSLYGLPGYDVSRVRQSALYPSPFAQFNDLMDIGGGSGVANEKSGSVNKKNRHKKKSKNVIKNEDLDDDDDDSGGMSGTAGCMSSTYATLRSLMTSDSEVSSSDYDSRTAGGVQLFDGQRIERSLATKIRLISYESLSTATGLFDKRVIFGFWSAFMQSSAPGSLLWSIPRESSIRVRLSALNFLHRLLSTGNPYVMTLAADDKSSTAKQPAKHLSFTSLSQSLAAIVAEVHGGMNSLLFTETNLPVLVQTFKCLSLLVTISPYRKLKSGLLVSLCDKSLSLLSHKDIQIQNSSLSLTVKVFELDPFPDEMLSWIETTDGLKTMNKVLRFSCDSILSSQSILLCGESLRLLTTIMKQKSIVGRLLDRQDIHLTLNMLMNISHECLDMDVFVTNLVLQSLFCKFLFVLGTTLKRTTTGSLDALNQKSWWTSVLKTRLIDLGLKSSDPSIPSSTQCVVIDFISTISPEVFDLFDPKLKFHLISILISIVKSLDTTGAATDDLNSQSAAIRCLGVYQLFPSMIDDMSYLLDVAMLAIDILDNYRDVYHHKKLSHLLLYQTSWTLANFCDILKKFYTKNTETMNEITDDFLTRLIQSSLNCFDIQFTNAMQSDNIKTNLVRSAASALYVVLIRDQNHEQVVNRVERTGSFWSLFVKLIEKFLVTLKGSKNFKLQWNICIAFSYLLDLNGFLTLCECRTNLAKPTGAGGSVWDGLPPVDPNSYKLIDCIFDTLISVMQSTRNHKVQSYAVQAICSVTGHYLSDNQLISLWLLVTNFMCSNVSLVPMNIRDNWFEKYCQSIGKLIDNYFNNSIKSDERIQQMIDYLFNFLENDLNFMSNTQERHEFVSVLINKLKSL